jgi:hypothetical protein
VEDQVRLPRALGHVFRVMLLSLARYLFVLMPQRPLPRCCP